MLYFIQQQGFLPGWGCCQVEAALAKALQGSKTPSATVDIMTDRFYQYKYYSIWLDIIW